MELDIIYVFEIYFLDGGGGGGELMGFLKSSKY